MITEATIDRLLADAAQAIYYWKQYMASGPYVPVPVQFNRVMIELEKSVDQAQKERTEQPS